MKPDDILKLINAGYTKEEIQAMEPNEPQPQEEPKQPLEEPKQPQEEPKQPAEQVPENKALDEVRAELKTTQEQLASLVKQMQQNNLATASVNILQQNDLDKRTDEAMAELIRPKIERKGDNNVGQYS